MDNYLGKSSNKKLSDDGFLKDHWIMYFRYDRKTSNVFKEDLLSKEFTAKRVLNKELHIGDIDKYVTCLRKSVKYWFYINCPDECEIEGESKMWLTRLSHVGSGSFRPLLMATFFHKKPEDDFSAFLKACERFRFLVFGVSGRRANTEDYHFYGMAHDFFTGKLKTSIQDLTNDINKRTLDWLNIDNFIKETVDRYQKRHGFYSWAGIRYFLYEYERELQENAAGREIKVNWDIFENNEKDKVSIEHIFPQTPDNPYWTQRFDDKDKSLTHSLGNLLLLSVAKNSKLQNGSFIEKKQKYKTGSHSEIKIAEKEEWTPNDIIERGKELLDFLKRHWEIDCDFSEEEISELLNIKPAVIENVTELDNNEDYDNDDMLVDESYE